MKASEPRNKTAKSYQTDYTVLISFIEHLTYLRNLYAHHSRVWNKKMTKTMQLQLKHVSLQIFHQLGWARHDRVQ